MKTEARLSRIAPEGLGGFFALLGLFGSLVGLAVAFLGCVAGATSLDLSGFFTLKFSYPLTGGSVFLLALYPFANAVFGYVTGAVIAWIYNFYASRFGGISITFYQS